MKKQLAELVAALVSLTIIMIPRNTNGYKNPVEHVMERAKFMFGLTMISHLMKKNSTP